MTSFYSIYINVPFPKKINFHMAKCYKFVTSTFHKGCDLDADQKLWSKNRWPFTITWGGDGGVSLFEDKLSNVTRGMVGGVVVLLHSTGQTQVISSSQKRTRHSRATEDPHGEKKQREMYRHYNRLSSIKLKRKYGTIFPPPK